MCLQTGNNVTTIGSQTSGADGAVSYIAMAGGEKTMFTGGGVFYPYKTEKQKKGIKIDIVVQPSIKGIMEGKVELFESAITFLNE
jgi:carboxyl-terminal processing protease